MGEGVVEGKVGCRGGGCGGGGCRGEGVVGIGEGVYVGSGGVGPRS